MRKPLYAHMHDENALWPYAVVAEARKRVAARRYLIKTRAYPVHTLSELPTAILTVLCKFARDRHRDTA